MGRKGKGKTRERIPPKGEILPSLRGKMKSI